MILKNIAKLILIDLVLFTCSTQAAVAVFEEDFTNPSIAGPQGTLVGFFAPIEFGDIVLSQNSSIENGVFEVTPNSNFDGIAIALDPSLFGGVAGEFSFNFDIVSLELNSQPFNIGSGSAQAAVFQASGFDFEVNNNSLLISTFQQIENIVTGSGSATVGTPVIGNGFTDIGTNSLDFSFDGTSTVVLVLGSIFKRQSQIGLLVGF